MRTEASRGVSICGVGIRITPLLVLLKLSNLADLRFISLDIAGQKAREDLGVLPGHYDPRWKGVGRLLLVHVAKVNGKVECRRVDTRPVGIDQRGVLG